MKPAFQPNSGQSAKKLASAIARQIAQEPYELIKEASQQTAMAQTNIPGNVQPDSLSGQDNPNLEKKRTEQKNIDLGRVRALEKEADDIRKMEVFKIIQQRIAAGEDVELTSLNDLTREQKEVLMAQMQAVKARKAQEKQANNRGGIQTSAKKGRRLFSFGKKQKAQELTTRVEKPTPPSG
jgi:hypothetical protein